MYVDHEESVNNYQSEVTEIVHEGKFSSMLVLSPDPALQGGKRGLALFEQFLGLADLAVSDFCSTNQKHCM